MESISPNIVYSILFVIYQPLILFILMPRICLIILWWNMLISFRLVVFPDHNLLFHSTRFTGMAKYILILISIDTADDLQSKLRALTALDTQVFWCLMSNILSSIQFIEVPIYLNSFSKYIWLFSSSTLNTLVSLVLLYIKSRSIDIMFYSLVILLI